MLTNKKTKTELFTGTKPHILSIYLLFYYMIYFLFIIFILFFQNSFLIWIYSL